MPVELVLTSINTTVAGFDAARKDFEAWLRQSGAREITARNYCAAIRRWLETLRSNTDLRPAIVRQRAPLPRAMKRMIGYACRRYTAFASEVLGVEIDLGIPSRLPTGSRPGPKPISDDELQQLSRAAKKLFPRETALSFRVWLHFLDETGCRRSESEIDWTAIDWSRHSVVVRGKTGTRELPLSARMVRKLEFLFRRKRKTYPWTGNKGQRLSGEVLYYLFKRGAAAIGRPGLRPHLLRHRRLTRLCSSELGTNQLLVLNFAGSSSLESLPFYYAVSLEEKRRLLAVK
jgi:site-specific recombinase XerD